MTTSDPRQYPDHLLLFDGECNLCSRLVQFILRHDHNALFRFAALRSGTGRHILHEHGLHAPEFNSIVYLRNGRLLTRSTAVLHVARDLGGGWSAAYVLLLLPLFLRDAVYNLVARRRYRWFGRSPACMVPAGEYQNRFLP